MKKNIIISVLIIIIGGLLVYIGYDNFIKVNKEEQDDMLILYNKYEKLGLYEIKEIFKDKSKLTLSFNGKDIALSYNEKNNTLYINDYKVEQRENYYLLLTNDYLIIYHNGISGMVFDLLVDDNANIIDLFTEIDNFLFTDINCEQDSDYSLSFFGQPYCGLEDGVDCPLMKYYFTKDENSNIKISKELVK